MDQPLEDHPDEAYYHRLLRKYQNEPTIVIDGLIMLEQISQKILLTGVGINNTSFGGITSAVGKVFNVTDFDDHMAEILLLNANFTLQRYELYIKPKPQKLPEFLDILYPIE